MPRRKKRRKVVGNKKKERGKGKVKRGETDEKGVKGGCWRVSRSREGGRSGIAPIGRGERAGGKRVRRAFKKVERKGR